jgi:uncharacterized phage protein (TIGR01671 family)
MKREIRFRAWDNNSQLMIEHVVVYMNAIGFFDDEDINEQLKSKGFNPEDYLLPENWSDSGEDWYFVDSNYEVMQFTGLKDKDGVDIYEGDILSWTNGQKGVRTPEGLSKFVPNVEVIEVRILEGLRCNIGDRHQVTDYLQVIGNIYQHPHLLMNGK